MSKRSPVYQAIRVLRRRCFGTHCVCVPKLVRACRAGLSRDLIRTLAALSAYSSSLEPDHQLDPTSRDQRETARSGSPRLRPRIDAPIASITDLFTSIAHFTRSTALHPPLGQSRVSAVPDGCSAPTPFRLVAPRRRVHQCKAYSRGSRSSRDPWHRTCPSDKAAAQRSRRVFDTHPNRAHLSVPRWRSVAI